MDYDAAGGIHIQEGHRLEFKKNVNFSKKLWTCDVM